MDFRAVAVALLTILVQGNAVTDAHAETLARLKNLPEAGPVLSGDQAVWVRQSSNGRLALVRGAGRTRRLLYQAPAGVASPRIAASESYVALQTSQPASGDRGDSGRFSEIVAGPVTGSLRSLGRCLESGVPPVRRSFDIFETRLATPTGPGCSGPAVVDLAGAVAPRQLPAGATGLRLAAGHIAYLESVAGGVQRTTDLRPKVVTDDEGRELLRVHPGMMRGNVASLDVDQDGTLLLVQELASRAGAPRFTPVVASRRTPSPRTLDLAVAPNSEVELAEGRIGLVQFGRKGDGRLVVVPVGGGRPRAIADLGKQLEPFEAFDFDGRKILFAARSCNHVRLIRTDVQRSTLTDATPEDCSLKFARRPVVRERRIRLRISCASFRASCAASVAVRARGRVIARGSTAPGGGATLRVRAAGRRLLRSADPLSATVEAKIEGDSSPVTGAIINAERRGAKVLLRTP